MRWAEAAVVFVAAAVGAVVVRAVVSGGGIDAGSGALGPLWACTLVALALAAWVAQARVADERRARLIVALLAGLGAGIVMLPLMAGLHGTDQPPFTIARGDMQFRAEYVTRFASTWQLDDYTFRGLDAFYPPGWFWLAGRAAHVLGVMPWRVIAPLTIATIGLALVVAYGLWRMALSPAAALSATIGSLLVLPAQVGPLMASQHTSTAWYSSYSCFVAITGVAWLAATLVAVRAAGGGSRRRLALLAVVGAVLALFYYLLFIILALVLAALALLGREGRTEALRRVAAVGGGIALLTAVFWVPLVAALLGGASSQGHYVTPEFYDVHFGLDGPAALSVLAAVAICALALTRRFVPSRAVAGVLVGTVLWQIASVASLEWFHNQLQPHRAVAMMWAAFGAAVPVAVDGRSWVDLSLRVPRRPAAAAGRSPHVRGWLALAACAAAVVATVVLGARQGTDLASGPLTAAAHKHVDLAGPAAMSRFITATTGRRPQQLTIVSGDHTLLATEPYWGFFPLRARYAHPEARLPQRVVVLRAAAACPDAACTTQALDGSRFGPIDALVLARVPPPGSGWRVRTEQDRFPTPLQVTITFRRGSFDPAAWATRDVGAYTVFAHRR